MSPTRFRHTKEETARLGTGWYERVVKPTLRPEDEDKFVAIDVDLGDFELDIDDLTSTDKLIERRPNAHIWLMRVGHPAAYRLGGFPLDRTQK
jgi:hypothetical protein